MESFLEYLKKRVRLTDCQYMTYDELAEWPVDQVEKVKEDGCLRQVNDADGIICRECPEHCWKDVEIREKIGRKIGVFHCEDEDCGGLMTVELERLQQWEIIPDKLIELGYVKKGKAKQGGWWPDVIQLEAEACAARHELEGARVVRVFQRLDEIRWHGPNFPWSTALDEAIAFVGPAKALELFEETDLMKLAEKVWIVGYLNYWFTPFYTLDELADLMALFADSLEQNRKSLIETGFPHTSFGKSYWFDRMLNRLLYVRVPVLHPLADIVLQAGFGDPRDWDESRMNGEGFTGIREDEEGNLVYDYLWAENPELLERRIVRLEDGDLFVPVGFGQSDGDWRSTSCTYDKAGLLPNISVEDVGRTEELRPKFLDMKIRVLCVLREGVINRKPWKLWDECRCVLAEMLTAEDIEFLVKLDKLYAEVAIGGTYSRSRKGSGLTYRNGGLSDLLDVIGMCEKELKFGSLHRTKEAMLQVPKTLLSEPISIYYKVVGEGWQPKIDDALEKFLLWESEEDSFWGEYQKRVNDALKKGFGGKVPVSITAWVEPKHKNLYEPNVQSYANFQKTQLETTGQLAPLKVEAMARRGASVGVQDDTGRDKYAFRPDGDVWKIGFKGKRVPPIRRNKRMLYIVELLKNPHKEISALELCRMVNRTEQLITGKEDYAGEDGHFTSTKSGIKREESLTALDGNAVKEYQARLKVLRGDLDKAKRDHDLAEEDRIQGDIDFILGQLRSNQGIGGKLRKFGDERKRAGDAATRSINRAKNDIKPHSEELFQHLENTIRSGDTCSYKPDQGIDWQF